MRIALGIEYDGSAYCGWQTQASGRAVQAAVDDALSRIADEPISVQCAGRTDAGVHACCQVVHFDTKAERAPRAWSLGTNSHLPRDVAVRWAHPVADDFHARFSAESRVYAYVISNRPTRPGLWHGRVSWHYRPLDVQRMNEAASSLLGEHDFSAFRAAGCQAKHPVRRLLRLDLMRRHDCVVLTIEANAFLQHMVRNIAGVLMEIGAGAREPAWAREVLEGRDRRLGGVTAAPGGLYFLAARYPQRFGLPATPPEFPFSPG
jgi:tRNA pseudouridine38-40 synthase